MSRLRKAEVARGATAPNLRQAIRQDSHWEMEKVQHIQVFWVETLGHHLAWHTLLWVLPPHLEAMRDTTSICLLDQMEVRPIP